MEDELHDLSRNTSGWSEDPDGKALRWSGKYANFAEALAVVNQIGALAEMHDHHPDVEFGWGYVRLTLTTHDADGLTKKDFELADALKPVLKGAK
jgi:4a-hydroxytetrahydrobiopterin dehydratase